MATALDPATIQELLSKQKSRGDYDVELREFLAGGEAGIEVSLSDGRFAGKPSGTVKTGLDNARKRTNDAGGLVHEGAQNVKVIESDGHVYLINVAVSVEA